MSLKSKSRGRSKTSSVITENGQPIDKKTKQLLFYECEIGLVSRTVLKEIESFTQERANELLQKNSKKKAAKCMAYFLIDRIRFQKKGGGIGSGPFRKEINYREMKHFFVFPNYPDVFMLCVVDEKKNKRSYELYRCKTAENVNIICDLTYRASTDKQNILHDAMAVRQISMFSRASTNELSVVDYEHSLENSPSETKRESEFERKISIDNTQNYRNSNAYEDRRTGRYTSEIYPSYQADSHRYSKESPIPNGNIQRNNLNVRPLYTCYGDITTVTPNNHSDINITESSRYIYAAPQTNYITSQRQPSTYSINQGTSPDLYKRPSSGKNFSNHSLNESPPYTYTPVIVPKAQVWNQEKIPERWSHTSSNRNSIKSTVLRRGNSIIIEKQIREDSKVTPIKKAVSNLDLRFGDEVTFLSFDPISGTHITDNGPMYMYITRYDNGRNKIDESPNVPKAILYQGK